MISVADAVGAIVLRSPLLSDGLGRHLLNVSAVAREIRPEVERRVAKPVTEGAIVMALRRLPLSAAPVEPGWSPASEGDLVWRSNLFEVTYATSSTLFRSESELLRLTAATDSFVTMTSGLRETTVVASQELAGVVHELFAREERIGEMDHLSAITIRLPAHAIAQPGSYAQLLKLLAWQGVNVVEVVSTYRELTILLRHDEAERAWAALHV